MAATEKGVWNLQEVRDKQLASEWAYDAPSSSFNQTWTTGASAMLGVSLSGPASRSSPVQVPGTSWGGPSSLASIKLSTGVGELFRMWLKNDGTIWGAGSGRKLGQNNPTTYSSPKQLGTGTDWRSLSTSWAQTVAVKTDGTMYSWGEQSYGELGQNNNTVYSSPRQIPGTTWGEWVSTASGYNVSMNIKTDGTLWAWGQNTKGGLGQNSVTPGISSPVQVGSDTTWDWPVSGGGYHCGAVKTDGTLWTWGANDDGQLGHTNKTHYSSPVQCSSASNVTEAQFAIESSYFVSGTSGFSFGKNTEGQLGHNNTTSYSSPKSISGSWKSLCGGTDKVGGGIKTNGTLWAWGDGGSGALGQNEVSLTSTSPKQIGSGTTWTLISGVRTGGNGGFLATKSDGTMYKWGAAGSGANGLNNETSYSSPIQIPGTLWSQKFYQQNVNDASIHLSIQSTLTPSQL